MWNTYEGLHPILIAMFTPSATSDGVKELFLLSLEVVEPWLSRDQGRFWLCHSCCNAPPVFADLETGRELHKATMWPRMYVGRLWEGLMEALRAVECLN